MSIPVPMDRLAATLADFDLAYLLTVTDDGRSHVAAVSVAAGGAAFAVTGTGRGSRRNAAARPAVTLLWPPRDPHGHSLIVDGTAETAGEDLTLTPSRAVLHRPAPAPEPAAGACGADCVELVPTPPA